MAKCIECSKFYPYEDDATKGTCVYQKRDSTIGPLYWDTKEVKTKMEACMKFEEKMPLLEQIYKAETVPERRGKVEKPF